MLMISVQKGIAVAVLALTIGCSANNAATNSVPTNTVQKENSQAATQSSNPIADNSKSDGVNDTLIIPGKRVGSVTSETTRADLVQIYGESNLKDETILQAEGTISVAATKVNPGTNRSLVVFWKDNNRKKILYIRGFGSEWKTPEGTRVGTSLKELRQQLGEFQLSGFGWDYGGLVNLEGTKLSEYQGKLSLRLDADQNAPGKYSKQYGAVSGDQQLSSTNPNLEPLDVRISQITVNFGE